MCWGGGGQEDQVRERERWHHARGEKGGEGWRKRKGRRDLY